MQKTALKQQVKSTINELSKTKLKIAMDFLEYLKQKDEEDETLELLKEPGLLKQYKQAKKDIETKNTVKWQKIKRNV